MKGIYLKVLTHEVNPELIINNSWIIAKKVMIKWKNISVKWWKYWYNGIIIWLKIEDFENEIISDKLNIILLKLKNFTDLEFNLYIELSDDNNLHWTYFDCEFLKYLWSKRINLNII